MISRPHCRWMLAAALLSGIAAAHGGDLPWTSLMAAHESRDPQMAAWDARDVEAMIEVFNNSQKFKFDRFTFSCIPISKLLGALTPFADLHFDAINPAAFTPGEKAILKEWLKRGGFLAAYEDTYPYEQEDFRKKRDLPVVDFFTIELPAEDPDFTVGKAAMNSPFFRVGPFPTDPPPMIQAEEEDNPNFFGYTTVSYKGRVVVFFLGRYAYMEDRRWIPLQRPFPEEHNLALESYSICLNMYFYAATH